MGSELSYKPELHLPQKVQVTRASTIAGERPLLLDDGTILTYDFKAFTENGKNYNPTMRLGAGVITSEDRIWNSYVYRSSESGVMTETIYLIVGKRTVYNWGYTRIISSTDKGVTWTIGSETSYTYGTNIRSCYRILNHLFYVKIEYGIVKIVDYNIGASGSTYTDTSGVKVVDESVSNIVLYSDSSVNMLVFSVGTYVFGFNLSTHTFTLLTNFTTGYSGRSNVFNNPHINGIYGKFPNLYIALTETTTEERISDLILPSGNVSPQWATYLYLLLFTADGSGIYNNVTAEYEAFTTSSACVGCLCPYSLVSIGVRYIGKDAVGDTGSTVGIYLDAWEDLTQDGSSLNLGTDWTDRTVSGFNVVGKESYLSALKFRFYSGSVCTGLYIDYACPIITYNYLIEDITSQYAYIYKLTAYGNTADSWVWSEFSPIERGVLFSHSVDDYTYFAMGNTIHILEHETGRIMRICKARPTFSSFTYLAPTQILGSPFIIYYSGSVYYNDTFVNCLKNLDEVKSYHYIQGFPSSALINTGLRYREALESLAKGVRYIFYDDPEIHPATMSFRDILAGTNPVISNVSYSSYTDVRMVDYYWNHKKVLCFYNLMTTNGQAYFYFTTASTTFATISFYLSGYGDANEANYPTSIQIQNTSGTYLLNLEIAFHPNGIRTNTSPVMYLDRSFHYFEFELEISASGYRGLATDTYNLYIDGVKCKSGAALTNYTDIYRLRLLSQNGASYSSTYIHYAITSIASTSSYDHPASNKFKGYLGFSGSFGGLSYTDGVLIQNIDGIDSELLSKSTNFPTKYMNPKEVIETAIDLTSRLIRYRSVDPNGELTTDRIVDNSSTDFATIFDDQADLEDCVTYITPNGVVWFIPIASSFNTLVVYETKDMKGCSWNRDGEKSVNRVVVYGRKYSTSGSGGVPSIKQICGISQDLISIENDGVYEILLYRPNCVSPQDAEAIALNYRTTLCDGLDTPYKLVTIIVRRYHQVGTIINCENTVDAVENADRFVTSQEYDYKLGNATITTCESLLQEEDPDRLQSIRDTQKNFQNQFIDSEIEQTTYQATDQIILKNSIASLQSGYIGYTPIVVNTNGNYKTAVGVLGKEWEEGSDINNYPNWSGSGTTLVEDKDSHKNAVKFTNTSAILYQLPSAQTSGILSLCVYLTGSSGDLYISLSDTNSPNHLDEDINVFTIRFSMSLLQIAVFGNDGAFSWSSLIQKFDADVWNHLSVEWVKNSTLEIYFNGLAIAVYNGYFDRLNCLNNSASYLVITGISNASWIDAIGLDCYGFKPFLNYADGIVSCQGIIEQSKSRGLWLKPRYISYYTYDFNESSLTVTGSGYGSTYLDLSSLAIPPSIGTKAALVIVYIYDSSGAGEKLWFYNDIAGDGSWVNAFNMRFEIPNDSSPHYIGDQFIMPIYKQRLYYYYSASITTVRITIAGWLE